MIRVTIPHHLRNLAGTGAEVMPDVPPPVTQRAVLDAPEAALRSVVITSEGNIAHER